jgi:Flp pilus assembly protein TadD
LQHGGPLERAEAELSRALEVGGENPRLLHGLAQVRERQGRMGEAAALAHRAASLGKDAGLWLFAGQLSTREGNFGAAAEAFGKAAGLTHDNPLFLLEWSLALERNKQLVEALESAQAGLRAATGTAVEQRLQARVTELMERRN